MLITIAGRCPSCGAPIYGPELLEYHRNSSKNIDVVQYTCYCRHAKEPSTDYVPGLWLLSMVVLGLGIVAMIRWG